MKKLFFIGMPSYSREAMLYSLLIEREGEEEEKIEIMTDPDMIKMIQKGKMLRFKAHFMHSHW